MPVLMKKKKFSHKKNTVEPPLSGTWPLNRVAAQYRLVINKQNL